jgi:tRNA1Val (adenine37-N6)-methyltransferase
MPNSHFQFKQFRIDQAKSGMKVTTDGCLFGAWVADQAKGETHQRALDIGTGTGLLSLMLAQQLDGRFDAVESNELAFEEAKQNVANSPWSVRISVHLGTIQAFHSEAPFDLIICNPPFFHQNLKGVLPHRNAAIHSDLLSANDLAETIDRQLSSSGLAFVMYPAHEMQVFSEIVLKMGIHPYITLRVKDNPTGEVIRMMCGFSREEKPMTDQELIIKTASGVYGREFTQLLSPYYLYLDET